MIETISLEGSPEWDELIADASGSLFQSRRWLSVLSSSFDLSFEAQVETSEDRFVAGLPYCVIRDFCGPRIKILPFSDFVYPKIDSLGQWYRLIEPLMNFGIPISIGTGASSIINEDKRFVKSSATVRHYVSLDGDLKMLESRFATLTRRNVRRAQKAGVVFRLAENKKELRAFYELHHYIRKHRYQLLCQPYGLFEAIWEQLIEPGLGGVIIGCDGDLIVGGCLLLQAGDTLYYKYAASHPDYRSKGVSHAAVRAAMAWGLQLGACKLDLGRSDLNQPGLVEFKRRFGAIREPLATYHWRPPGYVSPNDNTELIGTLSRLLSSSEVSDEVSEKAGQLLYKFFA